MVQVRPKVRPRVHPFAPAHKELAMTNNLITSLTAIICISISGPPLLGICRSTTPGQLASGRATMIGEVTSVDLNSRAAVIKTDAGQFITLSFGDNTRFLKVRPGETALS